MKIKRLTKKHANYNTYDERKIIENSRTNGHNFEFEELTEYNDNEIIYTICIKLNTNNQFSKKIIKKSYEKQESPIKEILKIVNNNDKINIREGGEKIYTIPYEMDELQDLIDINNNFQ